MGSLLLSTPGRIAVIRNKDSLPGTVSIRSSRGSIITSSRVIITGCKYTQNAAVQFQQTLLDAVYLYSFGDAMGQIAVSGLGFSSACDGASFNGSSGVDDILSYYQRYRVSLKGDQITVMVGRTPVKGFLIGCQVSSVNPEMLTYGFDFLIAALPQALDS